MTFAPEPLPNAEANKWSWVGYFSSNGEDKPISILANGSEARVGERVTLSFPGGASATPPAPDGITALDYNYDFKNDLVMTGAGGVRIYKQENGALTDVTARIRSHRVDEPRYTGVPADIELDATSNCASAGSVTPAFSHNGARLSKKRVPRGRENLRRFGGPTWRGGTGRDFLLKHRGVYRFSPTSAPDNSVREVFRRVSAKSSRSQSPTPTATGVWTYSRCKPTERFNDFRTRSKARIGSRAKSRVGVIPVTVLTTARRASGGGH